jgi:hypothetical protein
MDVNIIDFVALFACMGIYFICLAAYNMWNKKPKDE